MKMKILLVKSPEKQKLNFCGTLKTRVCLKYFLNDI